ncbi:alkaline phosphatase PafA [Arenibacter sp. ARW7G5Y1]|uniref:alkaline phosphatase PafA n=1 Tax=Arenibacter sp. ARW7G5Y1 TaxID=2135619 RepID=UPI000D75AA1C|nr:alkaline phosphatase PafA [Arenibacter sp. ARW7G5Y1]PXX26039.1 putative AlkP superfamily pyrophosphatase or phosphodiesterase [Arenibacter sp. ARW7G5Y1]
MHGLTKHTLFIVLCCLYSVNSFSQQPQAKTKLVVGVIVDQMRAEYLNRFQDKFSDDGFKRLMNDGFVCRNTHYNYIPTKTAPGHASVYTGTTPKYHGIIANEWYDRTLKKEINNVDDYSTQTIGGEGSSGQRSPQKMLSTTITDELQLSNDGKSKVISISLKDRGAILPGGHMSDGSYWYDAQTGNFISSTYYKQELPAWVEKFNKKGYVKSLLKNGWKTIRPIGSYTESTIDEQAYEKVFHHKNNASFPYEFRKLSDEDKFDIFQETPFGNTILAMLAGEALVSEKMGQGAETDFLAISFSSTDKIGHAFGPNSIEIEDTYLRLDQDIASLLRKLDAQVGEGNYTFFLTADHAATDVPQYLINNKVPAGYYSSENIVAKVNKGLETVFKVEGLVENMSNGQLFLDMRKIVSNQLDFNVVLEESKKELYKIESVFQVLLRNDLEKLEYTSDEKGMVQRGFHMKRSGDIVVLFNPSWAKERKYGTEHGTGYSYDTHVPLLWYGNNIPKGSSTRKYSITDIAPTISMLLGIKFPSACIGIPIEELFKE